MHTKYLDFVASCDLLFTYFVATLHQGHLNYCLFMDRTS